MEKNKLYKLDFSKLELKGEIHGHYAILKGENGIIITDDECVHHFSNENDMRSSFSVYPFPQINEDGSESIFMTPESTIIIKKEKLEEIATEEVKDISKWINYFGIKSRIKSNYDIFKDTCKEIGSTIVLPEWK